MTVHSDPPADAEAVPPETVRRIVELACLAPSAHNTQPWTWRRTETGLDLYADTERQLPAADPERHNLLASCGAALHHAQVVARELGWEPAVERFPDGQGSTLLARIVLTPAGEPADPEESAVLRTVEQRRTDRRRFTSEPVPDEQVSMLAALGSRYGVSALPLVGYGERLRVERLVAAALEHHGEDEARALEQAAWVDPAGPEGVPSASLPARATASPSRRSRFGVGTLEEPGPDVEASDGLLLFWAESDEPLAWLRAGEALSAVWLEATRTGMSVVPLTQVVEMPQTRHLLAHQVLRDRAVPLLLLRVGWQAPDRDDLPPTPRRPVEDVLRD